MNPRKISSLSIKAYCTKKHFGCKFTPFNIAQLKKYQKMLKINPRR